MTTKTYKLPRLPSAIGLDGHRFPSWRPWQVEPIESLANSPSRFNIAPGPCGSGKSAVCVGMAKLTGLRTLILTSTKGLQDQYLDDFSSAGLVDIRGQSNYECRLGGTCAEGARTGCTWRQGNPEKSRCRYLEAKNAALNSQLVITNYSYWLTLNRWQDKPESHLGIFDLIIMDEAHRVPNILSDFASFTIYAKEIRGLLDSTEWPRIHGDDIDKWCEWGGVAVLAAEESYRELRGRGNSPANLKAMEKVKDLGSRLRTLSQLTHMTETTWITQKEVGGGRSFTPLWGHHYAERWLYRGAKKVVATSATVGRSDAKYLGMECGRCDDGRYIAETVESDCGHCDGTGGFAYHEVSKSFPAANRPFVYCKLTPPIRVDYRMGEGEKTLLYRAIDRFIQPRLHQKGIIHCRSYARAGEVLAYSDWSDFMIYHKRANGLKSAVDKFKEAEPPAILLSPSIEEGFDFPADECRWQIVLKVPFVYGGDPLMKARTEEDKEYKEYLAAQSLVQMVGRPVRSADDWAQTVIFDSHWGWFGKKIDWQRWFSAAFEYRSGIGSVEVMSDEREAA